MLNKRVEGFVRIKDNYVFTITYFHPNGEKEFTEDAFVPEEILLDFLNKYIGSVDFDIGKEVKDERNKI